MAATTTAFETEIVNYPTGERGLMAGPAYKLRQQYLAGVVDPLAHTLALTNPRQLDALARNGKTASFAAITAV